ncbi:hypothetical protein CH372_18780 [Leptospira meyeri]|uniref:WD40 repeat domain-containing protein n=1 Tax=Leptospira meyeri TaxID=29508 RepID=UPI000C2A7D96|nr:hypothetical protein [Leptospira meyeri]PKA10557.1 hypothetical protein CH372_18780 [Leptospira meyeri]
MKYAFNFIIACHFLFSTNTISASPEVITTVAFSNNGFLAASGDTGAKIKLFDIVNYQEINVISEESYDNSIYKIKFTPDDKYIISGSKQSLNLWDYKKNKIIRSFPTRYIVSIDIHKHFILTGNWAGVLQYWDYNSGKLLWEFKTSDPNINSIKIMKNGKYAITGGDDAKITLWDLKKGIPIKILANTKFLFRTVDVSYDEKWVAGDGFDNIIIRSLTSEKKLDLDDSNTYVHDLKFSPVSDFIVCAGNRGINIHNYTKGFKIAELLGHNDIITSIDISKNGKLLISGSWDSTVKVWSLEKYNPLYSFGTSTFIPGPPSPFTEISENLYFFITFFIIISLIIIIVPITLLFYVVKMIKRNFK